jgi:polyketide biosynthesis enoyl-CoA hydratase PksI
MELIANELVRVERIEEGVVEVRLDDAANQNRLTEPLCRKLMDALSSLQSDRNVKVVLLSGRPDVFCGGATQEALASVSSGKVNALDLLLPTQMLAFPVPIVGALTGHAVGGGFAIALCCDLMVASETSRYGANFTDLGFTPGMGVTALLPALIGHHLAMEMMATARLYRGAELRDRALFNRVVPSNEVYAVALDIARRIAEKPRHVLEMLKGTLAVDRRRLLDRGMWTEHLMHRISFNHPDATRSITENYLTPHAAGGNTKHGQE